VKILILPFPLLAHYARCYELFAPLAASHDVTFAGDPLCCHFLTERGVKALPCESFERARVIDSSRAFDFSWLSHDSISRVFRGYVSLIRYLSPDIVVSDAAQVAGLACDYTGVPHLAVMNAYMSRWFAGVRGIPEGHPAEHYKAITPPWLFSRIVSLAEAASMYKVHAPFRALRKALRLRSRKGFLAEQEGDHTCVIDDPSIFPLKKLPPSVSLLGPVFYGVNEVTTREAPPLGNSTIIVSMGSSGDWEGLRMLTDPIFAKFSIRCVGVCPDYLTAPHITRVPFLSPKELYRDASAMICHGGNGTIYQAIAHGITTLCRPSFFDQEWNVTQFERSGWVARIPRDITPLGLYELIDHSITSQTERRNLYRFPSLDRRDTLEGALQAAISACE